MAILYGRVGRLATLFGGFRPGQDGDLDDAAAAAPGGVPTLFVGLLPASASQPSPPTPRAALERAPQVTTPRMLDTV